jgi:hypothetical protein
MRFFAYLLLIMCLLYRPMYAIPKEYGFDEQDTVLGLFTDVTQVI